MILVLQADEKFSFYNRKDGTFSHPKGELKKLVKDWNPSHHRAIKVRFPLAPHELCWWK